MFLANASSLKLAVATFVLVTASGCASSFETTRTSDAYPHLSELGTIRDTSSPRSDDHGASVLAAVAQKPTARGRFDASFR
jgi:hypothetical protein